MDALHQHLLDKRVAHTRLRDPWLAMTGFDPATFQNEL
jgi:hypothetical protein